MTEPLRDPNPLPRRPEEIIPSGGNNPSPHKDTDSLVDVALRLANAPHPKMPPEMSVRIKAKVMSAHHRQKQQYPRRFRPAFHWAAVASIVMILLIFGLTPSVLASLPGDTLYPFKMVLEWSELTTAGSSEAQAFTHLLHAERRAREALALSQHGQISSSLFTSSLAELSAALETGRGDAVLSAATLLELEARASEVNSTLNSILDRSAQSALIPATTLIPLMTSVRAMQNDGDLLSLTTLTLTPVSPSATPHTPTLQPTQPPAPVQAEVSNEDEIVDCDSPPPTWAAAEGWRSLCEGRPHPQDDGIGDSGPPPWAGASSGRDSP